MADILPADICDCHIHFYGPADEYPEAPTSTFPPPDASVSAYRHVMMDLGITRAVVVQPSAYGTDNRRTIDALAELGDCARGIAVVAPNVTDDDLEFLNAAGIRGIRLHMLLGGLFTWSDVLLMATRVHGIGWHVEIQMDGRDIAEHENMLSALPGNVVIDHMGKFLEPVSPNHPSFQALLRLIENGRIWVKLSGPYETSRSGPPDYADIKVLAQALITAAPERMVWATNWPHPSVHNHKVDDKTLMDTMIDWMDNPKNRRMILSENPEKLYRF